ncbi:hypothetical protein ACI6PS_01100 [Flavobacterium sp. PLA-1-15]|uniref:hypothetical protein n=1 Tax=Flavobacterium sp. PLA-1-15 TaxID=3380533 RepID=UPI003B772E24
MKTFDKKVNIPSYLHELHGKQSSIFDLLVNYTTVIITTSIIIYLAWNLSLSTFKLFILGIVALDLSGGVVSNFTDGTNRYYIQNIKMRYFFIVLHVVQPLLLLWLFPEDLIEILIIAIYTLIAVIIIDSVEKHSRQRVLGSFLMVIGISISFLMDDIEAVVHLMLILFIIKLIIAFAVKWK